MTTDDLARIVVAEQRRAPYGECVVAEVVSVRGDRGA
jgi:hypothetical protein